MAKGFADPVVSISSGKVDVVVNAPSITDAQRAQIEDIVKRKAEVGAESIIITLLIFLIKALSKPMDFCYNNSTIET